MNQEGRARRWKLFVLGVNGSVGRDIYYSATDNTNLIFDAAKVLSMSRKEDIQVYELKPIGTIQYTKPSTKLVAG